MWKKINNNVKWTRVRAACDVTFCVQKLQVYPDQMMKLNELFI